MTMKKSECIQRLPEGGYVFRIYPANNRLLVPEDGVIGLCAI